MGRNCWGGPLRLVALENTTRMLPGSLAETVCRNTALARVKMVVLAPMPSVSESTATSVKPGFFTSMRTAYFRSCRNVAIKSPRQDTDISLGRRKVKKDRGRRLAPANKSLTHSLAIFMTLEFSMNRQL